jgi:DNA end-binding protein Ku
MAARATGTATISFGLVSIPIKVYTATSTEGLSFHMLHKTCGTRVKMQLYCPLDKEVVTRRDTVKGYEHQKDQFVRFEDDDLRRLEAEKTERLDIVEFVPEGSIAWVYLADTHYLGPGKGGDRAYKLLSESMERMKRLAVGRYYTHGKTQLVLLCPYRGGLVMHRVHYAGDVRSMDDVERPGKIEFKPIEQELADKLVEQLSVPTFKPEQYRDDYRDRVLAAVEEKVAGREVTAQPAEPQAQVIDLFEALKRSLSEKKGAAAANEAEAPPLEASPPEARTSPEPAKLAKTRERRAPARAKKTQASS